MKYTIPGGKGHDLIILYLRCDEYVVGRESSVSHVVLREVVKAFQNLAGQLGQGAELTKLP